MNMSVYELVSKRKRRTWNRQDLRVVKAVFFGRLNARERLGY